MKHIAVLGSTGSIGTQTLDVVRNHPELFSVEVLACNRNYKLLAEQIAEFQPRMAVLTDKDAYELLKSQNVGSTTILYGEAGLISAATADYIDTVVTSLMGAAGLKPTMAAIEAKKNIALANKETLVVAGDLVMAKAREMGVKIMPIDSEHGALFQCLQGEDPQAIDKLLITASGGPFRHRDRSFLETVQVKDCLAHPTWNMGRKITIDSASLMNKGLEVIEAHHLYNVDYDDIQVVVHPQSIIHSMIQFCDGSVMAQLGSTDMRLPIQYALTYPERHECPGSKLDFWKMRDLTFEKPDTDTFEGIDIAYRAGKIGHSMPCVMNAANEIAVEAFLDEKIKFLDIYSLIKQAMEEHQLIENPSIDDLLELDIQTRLETKERIKHL